jgi:hypothetical protein
LRALETIAFLAVEATVNHSTRALLRLYCAFCYQCKAELWLVTVKMNSFDGYKLVTDHIDKINEEVRKINDKVEIISEKLLQAKKTLRKNPQETDAETEVEHYESHLTKLESQLTKLEADKERWFKLVEEEKKRGIFQEIYDARIEPAHSDFYSRSNKERNRRRLY